jgi:hypothetical protein
MVNCIVCGHDARTRILKCESGPQRGYVLRADICDNCGFVRLPENTEDWADIRSQSHISDLEKLRTATDERPGREFHMARLSKDVLGIAGGVVLFFGTGRNMDNLLFLRQHPEFDVRVTDLQNYGNLDNFVLLDAEIKAKIIIASEVIEHFIDPHVEFSRLFGKLDEGGVICASTNIYDGSNILQHDYPFFPGHCSYYTPEALGHIAAKNGLFVDFRLPYIALGRGGPRKRYVFFFRNPGIFTRLALYFGRNAVAPSEPD